MNKETDHITKEEVMKVLNDYAEDSPEVIKALADYQDMLNAQADERISQLKQGTEEARIMCLVAPIEAQVEYAKLLLQNEDFLNQGIEALRIALEQAEEDSSTINLADQIADMLDEIDENDDPETWTFLDK